MTSPLERGASTSRTTHRTPSVWRVLRRCGYRSGYRYIVFQLLPHTLGLGPDVWRVLDKCHKVRNQGEYEGFLNVDERLIADLIAAATTVLETLEALGPL